MGFRDKGLGSLGVWVVISGVRSKVTKLEPIFRGLIAIP